MGASDTFRKAEARLRAGLERLSAYAGLLWIPLTAVVAMSPSILRGVSCGHDFDFHLVSWMEARRSWEQGVLYPHWAQSPNWSAGEARLVFYPPLTWMLGAVLSYAMVWDYVPISMTFLFLTGIGFATRALAKELMPAGNATLAGALAASAPYALFTAYERAALGELAAAIWIPLLMLFTVRRSGVSEDGGRKLDGNIVPLSLVLAMTWLTNAPAGVMASYTLAFTALVIAILRRSWRPVLRAVLAALFGLGLAAYYLAPAAWEQRWITIQQAVDVGMRIRDSWLFARHPGPDLELHDIVLQTASLILTFTAVMAALGFGIALLRKKLTAENRHVWLPMALLIPVIVLLQFPISAPLWNFIPKMQFLQFPWRWLAFLGVPYAIFLAAATPLKSWRARVLSTAGWGALVLVIAAMATLFFFQSCDAEDESGNQSDVFMTGTGVAGTDEYAALGSDNSLIASGLPDACLVEDPAQELGESDSGSAPIWYAEQGSCDDTFTAQLWQSEHKLLQIDSDHDGFVILRLSRYPAWRITINGQPFTRDDAAKIPLRADGLIVLPVHEGPSTIEVRWTTTPDSWWGRGISALALALLAMFWILERRSRHSLPVLEPATMDPNS